MDVTVVVGTYGSDCWKWLAAERAIPSAVALGVPVVAVHGPTLHEARNEGLDRVRTEWVCHLDADDELEHGFFEAMGRGSADLRAPSVRYVVGRQRRVPLVPMVAGHRHMCEPGCLVEGNWLVVGTVARTQLLRDVGGWHDFEWSEDYDLWLRCYLAGASIEAVPSAIYRAHVRDDSRNRAPDRAARLAAHRAIAKANRVKVPV